MALLSMPTSHHFMLTVICIISLTLPLVVLAILFRQVRMIAFVNKISPNLEVLADLSSTKKAPAVVFFGRRRPKKGLTWACEVSFAIAIMVMVNDTFFYYMHS